MYHFTVYNVKSICTLFRTHLLAGIGIVSILTKLSAVSVKKNVIFVISIVRQGEMYLLFEIETNNI
jgi:hypothetical protein